MQVRYTYLVKVQEKWVDLYETFSTKFYIREKGEIKPMANSIARQLIEEAKAAPLG